jgi:hypothetical protein
LKQYYNRKTVGWNPVANIVNSNILETYANVASSGMLQQYYNRNWLGFNRKAPYIPKNHELLE